MDYVPGGTCSVDKNFSHTQEQIKQGWSLLSTLHCLMLSGKVKELGSRMFKKPHVELLAQRWQDRSLQVFNAQLVTLGKILIFFSISDSIGSSGTFGVGVEKSWS